MATKLGRMVIYFGCPLSIKSTDNIITWFCKIMWKTKIIVKTKIMTNWNNYIFIDTMSLDINKGRVGIYYKEIHSIISPDPLITGSCKQGHVNYFSCYIATTKISMVAKPDRVVTYYNEFPFMNSCPFCQVV